MRSVRPDMRVIQEETQHTAKPQSLKNKISAQIILQRLHNLKKGYKISQK